MENKHFVIGLSLFSGGTLLCLSVLGWIFFHPLPLSDSSGIGGPGAAPAEVVKPRPAEIKPLPEDIKSDVATFTLKVKDKIKKGQDLSAEKMEAIEILNNIAAKTGVPTNIKMDSTTNFEEALLSSVK